MGGDTAGENREGEEGEIGGEGDRLTEEITDEEMYKAIKSMKRGKAARGDEITVEFLAEGEREMRRVLCSILNMALMALLLKGDMRKSWTITEG